MTESSTSKWPRGFWPLMLTQFQGAFSDNALRWLVIFPVLISVGMSETEKESFAGHASLLFAIPFLLFSTIGGWMADHFSKRSVMIGVKFAEVGIMLFAAFALAMESRSLQLGAICLMGLHSTVFAPAKYGIMPEILTTGKLSGGNGILELLTFVGIILGTFAGGWLAESLAGSEGWSGMLLAGIALVGLAISFGIAKVPAADPEKKVQLNLVREIWRNLAMMKKDRDLWRANWGNTGFYFIAALVQLNLALFAHENFQMKPTEQAGLQAALSLGIGLGSVLAGQLSRDRIEYGLIPVGTILMVIASVGLGWPEIGRTSFALILGLLGLGGGLFIVPIVSILQHRPSAQMKGAVQGAASWLSWAGIAVAAVTHTILASTIHLSYSQIFWFCGVVAGFVGLMGGLSRMANVVAMLSRWKGRG